MTAAHKRGDRREGEAARMFGVPRQRRLRFESTGDLEVVELPCGLWLQPEVKTRKRLPKLIVSALAQASRYEPRAVPVAVISETGGSAIVALPLAAFVRIAGIEARKVGG